MWEDRTKINIIRNILLALASIALIYWLGSSIQNVIKRDNEADSQLMDVYQRQKEEQSAARKEQDEQVDIEYRKDLEVIERYMPGIVCWGDVLTAGSSGNVSYPDELQGHINENICGLYDITLSLDKNTGLSRVDWDQYKVKIPVVNMGAGQENTATVMGRSGVVPFVTEEDMVIPAGLEKVRISLCSENGQEVMPLLGSSAGINNVTIAGIEGVLSIEADAGKYSSYSYYYFNRIEEGVETAVPAGTRIITDASDKYKDYIHVVCMGTYGGFTDANELVDQVRTLLARQTENTDRFLVIGLCSADKRWYYNSSYMDIMDSAMMQAFGDRYINLRKYLCTDAIYDADMTLTSEDRNKTLAGVIPGVFMSNSGNFELTATAYKLLGKLVYDRMDKLGFFDEIKDELKIDLALQQAAKKES